jgi:type I restriction-modification system DNA methylase subunit
MLFEHGLHLLITELFDSLARRLGCGNLSSSKGSPHGGGAFLENLSMECREQCDSFLDASRSFLEVMDEPIETGICSEGAARLPGAIYESLLALAPSASDSLPRGRVFDLKEVPGQPSRKSTGTYYTPGPILGLMVEEALAPFLPGGRGIQVPGKPLAGPEEILNLKILDPAMGSGSFLVTVVDHLARAYRATLSEKESIVACRRKVARSCIFGVDLDPLAVFIARQSLRLFTLGPQKEALNLENRLMQGDALFGVPASRVESSSTIESADEKARALYEGPTAGAQESAPQPPYKADRRAGISESGFPLFFHWEIAFPEVFQKARDRGPQAAGFHVVLGNPPYGDLLTPQGKEALKRFGYPPTGGRAEIAAHFIHQGLNLLNGSGRLVYILPNTLIDGSQFSRLRGKITGRSTIVSIMDFPDSRVFPDAGVYGMILHLEADPAPPAEYHARYQRPEGALNDGTSDRIHILTGSGSPWRRAVPFVERLREKDLIENLSPAIAECRDAGLDYKHKAVGWDRRGEKPRLGGLLTYQGRKRHRDDKPLIRGRDIQPFCIATPTHFLKHDWAAYRSREVVVLVYQELAEVPEKIVTRQTSDRLIAAVDRKGCYTAKSVHTLIVRNPDYSAEYLCALLNSKVMNKVYSAFTGEQGRVFAQVKVSDLRILPVRKLASCAAGRAHPFWLDHEKEVRQWIHEGDAASMRALYDYADRLLSNPSEEGKGGDRARSGVVQVFVTEVVKALEGAGGSGKGASVREALETLLDDLFDRLYET